VPPNNAEKTLRLVRSNGVLRPRDLAKHHIPRQYLRILQRQGKVRRSGRGLYTLAEAEITESHSIAEACKRVPNAVICLLSAVAMHKLTTQSPHQVWIAIDRKNWKPNVDYPPLRVVRFSGRALTSNIQHRKIEGVNVRVYDPAKTVADCFKYRNKIGLDVAIEALRDCWRKKKATMDQLHQAAKICRVAAVIQPYLESLT
jgi:predicted transcriptional regulator of viral defense system